MIDQKPPETSGEARSANESTGARSSRSGELSPGNEPPETWAARFVAVADQVHAVITRHYGDCPDRDGNPLCSEIAHAVTEVAW